MIVISARRAVAAIGLLTSIFAYTARAQQAPAAGPSYTAAGELIPAARDVPRVDFVIVWNVGITTTNQPRRTTARAGFTSYGNPPAYREFLTTGQWPDKTIHPGDSASSSEARSTGRPLPVDLVVIEASVKDEQRFPGKWAYFDFGRDMKPQVAALPRTERCYACHTEHGAVDNTFVQFYPTLLDVARKFGSLRPSFASPSTAH